MPRSGLVIAVEESEAIISTSKRGICADCVERGSCSGEAMFAEGAAEEVRAKNSLGAKPGDLVEFDLPGNLEIKLSLVIWFLPLIGLTAGAFVGSGLSQSLQIERDSASLIFALAGLLLFFLPAFIFNRRASSKSIITPIITRVVRLPCPTVKKGEEPSSLDTKPAP